MANRPSLNDSLNKLQALSSSGEVAKVRVRRHGRDKSNSDNAKNLLGSLLDDSEQAAEKEQQQLEENRRRAEEEARLQREQQEEMARIEAERAIIAEKQAQEEMRMHRAEMQAQVQRQNDIDAGLIDLEEEARQKAAEEERLRQEAEARARKEAEKRAANELLLSQEYELEALRQEQLAKQAAPKKNKAIPIIIGAVAAAAVAAIVIYITLGNQKTIDIYATSAQYDTRSINFMPDEEALIAASISVVKQGEDPKPSKPRAKKPSGGAAAPAESKPKVSLSSSGKGGIFGGGKRSF
jgi:hypothetical protein